MLSADKKIEYTEGVELTIPVDDGDKIYAGALVCVNADGFAVPGSDTAGLIFEGISREYVDNSLGLDGAKTVTVRRRGLFNMSFESNITQANVGDNVFILTDEMVDIAANVANKIFCGVIAAVIDDSHAWVDIEPAIRQADVASHIADTSGAHAASAISIADAGEHFSDAENTVEAALQKLAKTIVITLPRFTGWTKDGADKTIALPALELPIDVSVKRAYAMLGTAPGAGKTLALKLNDSALVSIDEANVVGEAEDLGIGIKANGHFVIKANETAAGAGANCDIILIAELCVMPD
jgi:hypothetical protein